MICERFIDSSVAYQGYGLGLDIDMIRVINHWAAGGLLPDLTIYLDGEPAEFLAKTKGGTALNSGRWTIIPGFVRVS